MKWFYICYEDLSIQAAPAVHVRAIVRHLQKLGQEVVVFVPNFSKGSVNGVQTVYVPALKVRFVGVYLYQVSLFFWLLYHQLKTKAHVLYTRDMGVLLAPVLASKLFGCSHVVEVNGFIIEDMKGTGASQIKTALYRQIARINLRGAEHFVAVGDGIAERLVREYGIDSHKIDVVENGVDTELFKPIDRKVVLKRLGLPERYRYMVYVGSFYPHHRLECLVASLPLVIERIPDFRMLLVGDGYSKERIGDLVERLHLNEAVIFLGMVRHDEVPIYINAAELCLVFSSLALKMYEYLACGKPILANALDDSGRLIKEIGVGVAVDIEDPEKIADVLSDLLADKERLERMGKAGRKAVYSWEEATNTIIEICQRLVSERRGRPL